MMSLIQCRGLQRVHLHVHKDCKREISSPVLQCRKLKLREVTGFVKWLVRGRGVGSELWYRKSSPLQSGIERVELRAVGRTG